MVRVLAPLALMVFGATTAQAQPAAVNYGSIDVQLSSEAASCALQGVDRYNAYLSETLATAGVDADDASPVAARLALSAAPFADLQGMCVVTGELAFTVPLDVSDVEVVAAADKHEAIVAVFEQMEVLPVVLADLDEFTVSEPTGGDAAATGLIDALVKRMTGG